MTRPTGLIFVYNADSGLFNTITDAAHKILSPDTYACSLCRVTYGWFSERGAWRDFIAGLGMDCRFLHRDEFRARYPHQEIALPAVLRVGAEGLALCVDAEAIGRCANVDDLIGLLRERCLGA